MIYRTQPNLILWDTWMLKEGNEYHLFTLTSPRELGYWDRVCHAVSTDFINWNDLEDIVLEDKENKNAWDAGVILTGSTFKCEGGYGMTYGAIKHGDRVQRIGIIFSKDLHYWEKYNANPVLIPKGPFYEDNPDLTTENSVAWRDAYVVPVEGGYEAFIAANDGKKLKTINGCIARVFSKDLISWEYFPPIVSPEKYVDMEVPQYFELNGYHYFLFTTRAGDIKSRLATLGTYYAVAKTKYGNYEVPEDNMLIGSGEYRFDCYAGRVIHTEYGFLLHHHIAGDKTAFASPKLLCQDKNGNLWLERWKGLDKLLGKEVITVNSNGEVINAYNKIPIGNWERKDNRLIGDAGPTISGFLFEEQLEGCAIKVNINFRNANQSGVLFNIDTNQKSGQSKGGLGICLNYKRGVIQLCEINIESRRSVEIKSLDNVYIKPDENSEIEIFLRAEYAEIYYNKRPLFVLNISKYPVSGKVGFFVKGGNATFSNFQVNEIPEKLR